MYNEVFVKAALCDSLLNHHQWFNSEFFFISDASPSLNISGLCQGWSSAAHQSSEVLVVSTMVAVCCSWEVV